MRRQTSCQLSAMGSLLSTLRIFHPSGLAVAGALVFLLPFTAVAAEQKQQAIGETIYVVNEYRYVPDSATDDQEIGHSLCGTRCNALSSNINNIMEPGGLSLVRTGINKEITVELKSPFLGGQCICLADEYSVKVTDPGGPRIQRSIAREKTDDR